MTAEKLFCAEIFHSRVFHRVWWEKTSDSVWISTEKEPTLKRLPSILVKSVPDAAYAVQELLNNTLGEDRDSNMFPSIHNWNYYLILKKHRLIRDVPKGEGDLLNRDYKVGEEVFEYGGNTHGEIYPGNMKCSDTGDFPFFGIPSDALQYISTKTTINPYFIGR